MTTIPTEAIGNNIDLLTEILLRLPVKPLVRFKCISKQLLSLISDPQFCFSHTRHHHQHQSQYPTPTALLLKKAFDYTPEFEIIPIKHDTIPPKVPSFGYLNAAASGFHIRQSCNGLFLCSTSYVTRLEFEVEHIYYVCNPTTKHFKRLSPPACELLKESLLSKVCMAFDPLKSNHYKLIDVRRMRKTTNKYHINMYSSETDSWATSGITFTPPNCVDFSNPVFCNGAVHWYSKGKTSLYFDVDRECLNTMPMPKLGQRVVQYFGESRGHLHLILTEWSSPSQFDVLEMSADYSGWFVRYHVNLDYAVRIQFPENQKDFSVLHVVRAQKEEESIIVVLFGDDKTISYNFHDGTSKKLFDLEDPEINDYTLSKSFQYFEILTSV